MQLNITVCCSSCDVLDRPSSDELHAAATAGVEALNGVVVECGVVTTPLLHYRVVTANDGGR